MTLELVFPEPYDFAQSVCDHGWYVLSPNRWLDETQTLETVLRLRDGTVTLLHLQAEDAADGVRVLIDAQVDGTLDDNQQDEIRETVAWMLKHDEDLSVFYAHAKRHPDLHTAVSGGRGRLLRSATLFEDVVKTICTTNTTWRQTKEMVRRIVDVIGDPYPADNAHHAFPTAGQIAAAGDPVFEEHIRLGYRNAYVLQLAREVSSGDRDLEGLRTADVSAGDLKRELKSIKGVGDYAAHTLLMILGSYGEVGVDSEYRSLVRRKYFNDNPEVTDKEMCRVYDDWGDWKYLAYWFDAPVE